MLLGVAGGSRTQAPLAEEGAASATVRRASRTPVQGQPPLSPPLPSESSPSLARATPVGSRPPHCRPPYSALQPTYWPTPGEALAQGLLWGDGPGSQPALPTPRFSPGCAHRQGLWAWGLTSPAVPCPALCVRPPSKRFPGEHHCVGLAAPPCCLR